MSPAKKRASRKPKESRIGIEQGHKAIDLAKEARRVADKTRVWKLILDWITDPTQPNPDDPIASKAINALRAIPPHDVFLARGFEIAFGSISSWMPTDSSIGITIDEPATSEEGILATTPDIAMPITADDQITPPDAEWLAQKAADQAMNEAFAHVDQAPEGWTGGFWIDAWRSHHGMKTPADIRDYLHSQSRMLADASWRHELIGNARAALAAIDVSLVAFPKPAMTTCPIQAQEDVDRFVMALDAMIAPAAKPETGKAATPTPQKRCGGGKGGRPPKYDPSDHKKLLVDYESSSLHGDPKEFCREKGIDLARLISAQGWMRHQRREERKGE